MRDIHTQDDRIGHKYQLRHAAGLYWLLDMEQSDTAYIDPIPLNEGGAQIWKLLERNMPQAEICKWLCENYRLSPEEAENDLRDFIAQLQMKHVRLGGAQ